MDLEKEYKVVIYNIKTGLEEYEYFEDEEESIAYAKIMVDENTKTSVWLREYDEDGEYCIWESEE